MHHLSQRGRKDKKVIEARVASCTVKRDYGEIICRHHVWQWGRKGQKNLRQCFHAMCTVRRAYSGAGKVCSKIAVECDLLSSAVICLPVACGGLPFVPLWHPAAECNLLYSAEICLPVACDGGVGTI